jgi:acetyl-CoA carboxylase biotin carboxyl carrier protein
MQFRRAEKIMTIDEIKELIRVVHETGIAELEYQRGDHRVRIRSAINTSTEVVHVAPGSGSGNATLHTQHAFSGNSSDSNVHQLPASTGDEGNEIVKSPIVGTYYDSPAPGAGPFVKVGERVEPKQVLCIIESMKLMNEIESDFAGIVVAKHIENGRPVEYGESLFTIRPA